MWIRTNGSTSGNGRVAPFTPHLDFENAQTHLNTERTARGDLDCGGQHILLSCVSQPEVSAAGEYGLVERLEVRHCERRGTRALGDRTWGSMTAVLRLLNGPCGTSACILTLDETQ